MLNEIVHGDCLDVMPLIESHSIDMVLCDLPYGTTARNRWDVIIPFDKLWEQYRRICKKDAIIVLTAAQPFASQLIASNPKMFKYDLIWEKNKSSGFLNAKKMPLRSHEHILVFYEKRGIYNPQKTTGHKPVNGFTKHVDSTNYGITKLGISGGGQTDRYPTSILKFPVVNNDSKERIHPTQKPVELFEYLIRTFTDEGMVVLDNCAGSGTTAIACLRAGRKFIAIESDLEFFQKAQERIISYK